MIQSCTILKKITEFIKREIPEVKSLLSRRPLLSTRDPKNTISIEEASKLIKGKLTEILDKYQETSRDELETAISCWIVTTPLSRTLFNTRGYIRKQIQDVILERFKEASSKIIEDFKKEVKILSENRIKDILKKKST